MAKLLAVLIFAVSGIAAAQTPAPTPYPTYRRPIQQRAGTQLQRPVQQRPAQRQVRYTPYNQVQKTEPTLDGFSVMAGYTMAGEFDASAQNQAGVYNSGSSFNLGVNYGSIPSDGFGWMADLYYEFARSLNSVTQNGTTVNFSPTPSIAVVVLEADIAWAFHFNFGHLYPFAGVNYDVPMASNFASNFNISGAPGVQFGAGFHFMKNYGVELMYRTLNFGASSTASFDYFRLWGLALRAMYSF